MQYALIFNQTAEDIERNEDPVTGPETLKPWMAYMGELAAAGVMRGGNRLAAPWTATTVRLRNGARQIQDGPFAETKEQASGFVIIEVDSLDEAIAWAERSPSCLGGSTEVRPIIPMSS
jgi:hypothetical protein